MDKKTATREKTVKVPATIQDRKAIKVETTIDLMDQLGENHVVFEASEIAFEEVSSDTRPIDPQPEPVKLVDMPIRNWTTVKELTTGAPSLNSLLVSLIGPLPVYVVDKDRVAKMTDLRTDLAIVKSAAARQAIQDDIDILEAAGVSAAKDNHIVRQAWYTHAYSTLVDLLKVHAATSETHISFGPVSRNMVTTSAAPKPVKEKTTGETSERVRGERGIDLAEVVNQAYLAEKARYETSHVNHQFPGLTREQVEEAVKAVGRSSSVSWPTVLKIEKVAGSSPKVYRPIN